MVDATSDPSCKIAERISQLSCHNRTRYTEKKKRIRRVRELVQLRRFVNYEIFLMQRNS